MTTYDCKKDAARRLTTWGCKFTKLTARTVSFEGFGYGSTVFVKIIGGVLTNDWKAGFNDVPKPSDGGYCVELDTKTCTVGGKVPIFS